MEHRFLLVPRAQTDFTATDGSGNAATKSYEILVGTGSGERTLVYDVNGNLLNDGAGRTCSWDALNRLASVTVGGNTTSFVYDGAGRRVLERLNGSEIRRWVYGSGPQPIEERNAANQVTKRFYAGLGEQIGSEKYFYTTDHLGSVREMTDWSGNIRARYDYDPYGKVTKLSGDMESAFGFTGFYKHAATGLNLTLYRAYDAELGRWISRDPIGENGGINLYGYVGNNPVNAVDPDGRQAMTTAQSAEPALLAEFGLGIGAPSAGAVSTTIAVGVGGTAVVVNMNKEGDKTKERTPTVPIPGEQCPKKKDPCKELEKRLNEHIDKLGKYKANPDAYDNKNYLNNNPNLRDRIINGRIRHLENEIQNFQRLLENCRKNNPL